MSCSAFKLYKFKIPDIHEIHEPGSPKHVNHIITVAFSAQGSGSSLTYWFMLCCIKQVCQTNSPSAKQAD